MYPNFFVETYNLVLRRRPATILMGCIYVVLTVEKGSKVHLSSARPCQVVGFLYHRYMPSSKYISFERRKRAWCHSELVQLCSALQLSVQKLTLIYLLRPSDRNRKHLSRKLVPAYRRRPNYAFVIQDLSSGHNGCETDI